MIKSTEDLYEYKLFYLKELRNTVKNKNIGMNITVAALSEWGRRLIKGAAADLNCNIEITQTASTAFLAKKVKKGGYDFGAIIDESCENVTFIADDGRIVNEDLYRAMVALIIMKEYSGAKIVVEESAPSVIKSLAEKYGAELKVAGGSPIAFMGELCDQNTPPELREQFVYHFDAVGAVIRLLEFLKSNSMKLSGLLDEIPEFYIIRKEVACRNSDKGRVIKAFAEAESLRAADGAGSRDGLSRVLIVPDMKRPVCRVIIEASKEEYAEDAAERYKEKINKVIEN